MSMPSSLTPIIFSRSSSNQTSSSLKRNSTCWVTYKTAEIKSSVDQDHTIIYGTISLQCLRRSRVRILITDYELKRASQARLGSNGIGSVSDQVGSSTRRQLKFPDLHLYGMRTNENENKIRQKVGAFEEIRQHRALHLGTIENKAVLNVNEDKTKNVPANENTNEDVCVNAKQGEDMNHFTFTIKGSHSVQEVMQMDSIVIVMQHNVYDPEVLIASADFVAGMCVGMGMGTGMGASAAMEDRGDSSGDGNGDGNGDGDGDGDGKNSKKTGKGSLNINEPLDESTIRQYAANARTFLRNLGLFDNAKIDFDTFKQGLDLAGIIALEYRAWALFTSCDEQNLGFLKFNDLELCLMVNDVDATSTNKRITNLYEIFASYDVDNTGHLSFAQFQECISTPGLKSKRTSAGSFQVKDLGTLHYLFRKFSIGNDTGICYPSFVKLWSNYLVEPGYEIERRNLPEKVNATRIVAEFFVPFFKNRRRKNYLCKVVENDFYDASKFVSIKHRIIQLRVEVQANSDERRRFAKRIGRRQKRETTINIMKRNKKGEAFMTKILSRRKNLREQTRRQSIKTIQKDHARRMNDEKEAFIAKRRERDAIETEIIRTTFSDRLEISDRGFDEIPKYLYQDKRSQIHLMDIKILDCSRNGLKILPSMNFFYNLISLRKLSLSHNKLRSLPDELGSLKNLEILLLHHNCIEELPCAVNKLESIQVLNVSSNKLRSLSPDCCCLSSLRVLEMHSNFITVLPLEMNRLSKLESLDISNNKLSTLPPSLCSLDGIFKLNLASNRLYDLPSSFGELARLEDLDISCNEIQELPESVAKLRKLKVINLDDNKLMWVPDNFRGLKSIVSFSCERNDLCAISSEFGNMNLIEYFSCNMNSIQDVPPEIGLLKNLLFLKLQSNAIEVIPEEMGALVHLQRLDMSHNMITRIPHEFCLMKSLLWLDLSHNSLEMLPESFGTLSHLYTLNASHNKISMLPSDFRFLRSLEELHLSSNRFHDLDPILCSHLPIKILHLDANRIKYIPQEICNMTQLEELNLRHNDIRSIPLNFSKHTNSSGKRVRLDISQNPLSDLPMKFSSSENNQQHYQNPSGWDLDEVFEWMDDEEIIYKPAVDEWVVKKDAYLSNYLVFDDFLKGVLWRCENSNAGKKIGDVAYAEILQSRKFLDKLKQFFFYCKKHGNPPVYTKLCKKDVCIREQESKEREQMRNQRALDAKDTDFERRSQEYDRYLGNMAERRAKAHVQMSKVEEERRMKQHVENEIILSKVKNKNEDKNKMEAEKEVERALELKREAKKLSQISFQSHINKKRLLPVEIIPCWD